MLFSFQLSEYKNYWGTRFGKSDNFTFVTNLEETRLRHYRSEIVLGSGTVPCGCQVNTVPVEPIRDAPFRSWYWLFSAVYGQHMGIFMRQLLKWGVKAAGCSSAPVFNFSYEVGPYCMNILTVMSLSKLLFFPCWTSRLFWSRSEGSCVFQKERSHSLVPLNSRWYSSAGGMSVGSGRAPLFWQDFQNSASSLGKI